MQPHADSPVEAPTPNDATASHSNDVEHDDKTVNIDSVTMSEVELTMQT